MLLSYITKGHTDQFEKLADSTDLPECVPAHNLSQQSRASYGRKKASPTLVIHGGAGTMSKAGSTPEQREKYRAALKESLRVGHSVLQSGGEALDACVAAVAYMEDCPLFNCAKGAVFNTAGKNELECSVMLSKPPATHPEIPASRRGLALALLRHVQNPSKAARALYLSPTMVPHATLSDSTAEELAERLGEVLVDTTYFFTEARWREHRRGLGLPEEPLPPHISSDAIYSEGPSLDQMPTGTVGAVALDRNGCLAAVTSTGGKTNKLAGRIGDTPTFGCGFWAEEWPVEGCVRRIWRQLRGKGKRAVGISGTGDGDLDVTSVGPPQYFLRGASALTIAHRMRFKHESVGKAAATVVKELFAEGGIGGVIALDGQGEVAMPLNCSGMYRGVIKADGQPKVAIFNDDKLE
ncbi:hypothetical protein FRB96_007453 [Tulasnella sp. 330]|nr:hypothetical protein FRB96_007453 [Tulasnella sp. 330]KAG8883421.1 hypothetical protein FRB97_006703 [Tulasnella sp. 331]KAG8887464.1 hypothetical protein FRB98_009545 [Tulasnella sp. 332]